MDTFFKKTFRALGTVNTITASAEGGSSVLEDAEKRVLELDDRLSAFKKDSEISDINRAAGKEFVEVHPDTFHLIKESVRFAKLSKGTFDISARPIVELWGIGKKGNRIPAPREIAGVKPLINFRDILLDEKSDSVMLRRPGQALDLGGIAKGYAADEVRRILSEGGIQDAVINLGGTVIAMGTPRTIGIQDPRKETGVPMGRLRITDLALVTSGSYEKYFAQDGVRYHHIIDPRTGFPAQSGLLGVTLIGRSAVELDALSTAVFILGVEQGLALIKEFDVQAVFITEALDIFTTSAVKDNFSLILT